MRYVYVVTRIVEGETLGTPIPNLGMHKNLINATRHFRNIIDSRQHTEDYKIVYNKNFDTKVEIRERYKVVKQALMVNGDIKEELRLEKWVL